MIKNKFYKNLYQSISYALCVLLFVIILGSAYTISLKFEDGQGWILLLIIALIIVLYFCIGAYWIFQKVTIDAFGIRITILNKTIKECAWCKVESINTGCVMKNPALIIKIADGSKIHLDNRKTIVLAITTFSNIVIG